MAELQIIIVGENQSGQAFDSLKKDLGAVGQQADAAKEKGTGFFSGMLQTAGGFLAANVIGGIAGQFTSFIGGAISDSKEAAQIMAQTEAVIKSTGGAAGMTAQQVQDLAGSLSAAAGKSLFDDDDIQKGDNLLLTFTNIKETLPDATSVMVDMAQAMHTDVSGGAIQLGKALNDPINGISALSRVGVTFTDQQKQQIKTMQEAGDMAGAQKVILAELNKEFGGSAAAAAKADGGMAQFKAQLGDVGKQIGGALLPVLGQLTQFAITNLIPVLQVAAQWFADNLPSAIDTVTQAWQDLRPAIAPVIDIIQQVIAGFGSAGDSSAQLGGVVNDLAGIWQALQPVITNVVNAVGEVIQAVFGVVHDFIQAHGADISAFMKDAWTQIQEIIKLSIELYNAIVPPILRAVAGFIRDHGEQIQAILSNTWNAIKAAIDIALTLIKGIIQIALDIIHGDWSKAWEDIKAMSARIVTDLGTIIKSGLDNLKVIFSGAIQWIKDEWGALPAQLRAIGAAIVQGIQDGIANAWGAFKSWIHSKIMELPESVRTALGISSPSKVFAEKVGGPIIEGIMQGILGGATELNNALSGILDDALDAARRAITSFKDLSGAGLHLDAGSVAGVFGGGSSHPKSVAEAFGGGLSHAIGTRNFGGGLTMVGEFGPEMVALPAGSRIYTNSETRTILGGGGGGDTFNFYFSDSVSSYDRNRIERDVRGAMLEAGNASLSRQRAGG